MKLIACCNSFLVPLRGRCSITTKTLLVMKLIAIFIFAGCLQISARTTGQNITLIEKNAPLKKVLREIKRQSGFAFFYDEDLLKKSIPVDIDVKNVSVSDALSLVFKNQVLTYEIIGNKIITIKEKPIVSTKEEATYQSNPPFLVTGKVTDEEGKPLQNVSVVVKSTGRGVTTDVGGNFSIQVPDEGDVIIISYVGFEDYQTKVVHAQILNIRLKGKENKGDEVVVIGYGTKLKKDITSAISSIKGEKIENVPVASPVALLQGRVSGVQIVQNTGAPGGTNFTIRVRGTTSINAGNNPLYVIDGLPFESGTSDINPNDIASIEVLKDAAAAAIYGSRAANGVILITTKRGRSGETTINANYYTSLQQVNKNRLPQLLNATQFRELLTDQRANGTGVTSLYAFTYPESGIAGSSNTNWLDAIIQNGKLDNYDLSISGGQDKLKFYLSGNYFKQKGILVNSDYGRGTGKLNLDYRASEKFKIGLSTSFLSSNIGNFGGEYGPLPTALFKAPTMPVYNPDGTYFLEDISGTLNPLAVAELSQSTSHMNRFFGNLFGEYNIVPGLNLKVSWGVDISNAKTDNFTPSTAFRNGIANGSFSTSNNNNWINENTLNYTKSWSKSRVTGLLGFSQLENINESNGGSAMGYASNIISTLNAAATPTSISSSKSANGITSYFSRLNYSYDNKYYAEASVRRDGSSKFGENNRFATFPALSLGWQAGRESFFKPLLPIINELKIRGSYGRTGNQGGIGNYTSQGNYSTGLGYIGQNGIGITGIPNPDLKWETTDSYNLGLDISFFNSRITLSSDVYLKETSNLLLNVNLPQTSGFSSVLQNVGSTQNKGIEFGLSTVNIESKKFKWTSDFNMSFNQNKIIKLYNGSDIIANRGQIGYGQTQAQFLLREGESIGAFYGWQSTGVYAISKDNVNAIRNSNSTGYLFKGGDMRFVDQNGDGLLTDADRVVIGRALPNFTGGLTNEFTYGKWSLNIFAQFSEGNEIYNGTRAILESMSQFQNSDIKVTNRWRNEGDITDVPRADHNDPGLNKRASTRWIEDGSYLRIKTLTLGYSVPSSWTKKIGLSNARIYTTTQNLFTFTKYTGIDPEASFNNSAVTDLGFDYAVYPQYKTFLIGINVGF